MIKSERARGSDSERERGGGTVVDGLVGWVEVGGQCGLLDGRLALVAAIQPLANRRVREIERVCVRACVGGWISSFIFLPRSRSCLALLPS
jgi:hypothetical protein